jgi:hypothetical protein
MGLLAEERSPAGSSAEIYSTGVLFAIPASWARCAGAHFDGLGEVQRAHNGPLPRTAEGGKDLVRGFWVDEHVPFGYRRGVTWMLEGTTHNNESFK